MFILVEPAPMLAITSDRDLFQGVWNRIWLLVSPSTWMFVIRTDAQLWHQEAQSRNAQEIARRGGELHDELVAFVGDLVEQAKYSAQPRGSIARRETGRGGRLAARS